MRESELMALGFQLVGEVGVDSGQILISDPCYMLNFNDDDYVKDTAYIGRRELFDQLRTGFAGRFITHSGFGDGSYPVWVRVVDKGPMWGPRVVTVVIDFDPKDESDDEPEQEVRLGSNLRPLRATVGPKKGG